jgi:hypothetical protein
VVCATDKAICLADLFVSNAMSILTALQRKWKYSVKSPGVGRLVYREGNREYTFPIYEENGVLMLVDIPSALRIHFFFNWYAQPCDFSPATRARIVPRIVEHLRTHGMDVTVFSRGNDGNRKLEFHPELFEYRACASDLLAEAGFAGFGDYAAIDLVHEEYGLEITGIRDEIDARKMLVMLGRDFPHWHHRRVYFQQHDGEPGWTLVICMLASEPCVSGWHDES